MRVTFGQTFGKLSTSAHVSEPTRKRNFLEIQLFRQGTPRPSLPEAKGRRCRRPSCSLRVLNAYAAFRLTFVCANLLRRASVFFSS